MSLSSNLVSYIKSPKKKTARLIWKGGVYTLPSKTFKVVFMLLCKNMGNDTYTTMKIWSRLNIELTQIAKEA